VLHNKNYAEMFTYFKKYQFTVTNRIESKTMNEFSLYMRKYVVWKI